MIDSILMCNLIHRKTCLKHNYKHTSLVEVQDSITQALNVNNHISRFFKGF